MGGGADVSPVAAVALYDAVALAGGLAPAVAEEPTEAAAGGGAAEPGWPGAVSLLDRLSCVLQYEQW